MYLNIPIRDADVAMPLTDLGIDPETDLADQYDFTRTTASDSDGVQRGIYLAVLSGTFSIPPRYCKGCIRNR